MGVGGHTPVRQRKGLVPLEGGEFSSKTKDSPEGEHKEPSLHHSKNQSGYGIVFALLERGSPAADHSFTVPLPAPLSPPNLFLPVGTLL